MAFVLTPCFCIAPVLLMALFFFTFCFLFPLTFFPEKSVVSARDSCYLDSKS